MNALHWIPSILSILTILIIPLSTPSSIQIHDITNNAGALLLQRGEGRIIDGHDRLLHVIDFAQFELSLSIIEKIVNEIPDNSSQFSDIIKTKVTEIRSIYNNLNTKRNRRRRAIDMLGSAIKFITGNLDAEDLKVINSDLNKLRKNENIFIKQNNRQIKINEKFENRINLINKQIRDQENFIRRIVEQDGSIIAENQKILLTLQLDSFLENLKSIEYAIMLAKVNIINQLILSTREKTTIMQEMSKQGIEITNLDDASSYLTTTVLHRRSSIVICVNIPRLLPNAFKKIILEPLPRFNQSIKLMHNVVFQNTNQILAITSACQEINKVTICEKRQLVDISDHLCEASLLKGQPGQCPSSEKSPAVEIRIISPGTLLVVAVHQDVNINSTCGISNRTLTGIHMVTFHNCSLLVNNELHENYELWFNQPIINPILPGQIKISTIERNVNMTEIQELHLKNREHLETMDLKNKIGFVSLSGFIILAFVLLALLILKHYGFAKTGNCSGRAMSKGGRVKHGTTPATSIIDGATPMPSTVGPHASAEHHDDTQTAESAAFSLDTICNHRNAAASDDSTSTENVIGSSLGARLAVLGKKAGQLGL
ncbi:uncharacterized protein LOC129773235 [Toxorhynchites rutilus septentrionalis]|uniref:uncharacterized protein LOC129773235 n=1 Tax=Toxorhynchites rutilus septentrionalis TaxID=329112 RepID=UPI00247975BC|nr:uncharacterized protein LOC129773235 [Toxorhynchites rutilus septentrionalis]